MVRSSWFRLFLLCQIFSYASLAQMPSGLSNERIEPDSTVSGKIALKEKAWTLTRGATEWSVQTGYAPMQPTFFSGHKEYDTDGRKFAMLSFKFGRVIGTTRGVTFEYVFESSPYAVAINNEVGRQEKLKDEQTRRKDTLGITIQPAGFRFVFLPSRRLKPFAQSGAGFIFSRRPIPVPQSTNYNFVGDFGGGVMYSFTKQQVLKAGYRYYHISNMNIGQLNPGYNANMFYIDMSVFSK